MPDLDPKMIIAIVSSGIAAFSTIKWIANKAEKHEDRQRNLIQIAAHLEEIGMSKGAEIITDVAVGDWSAVALKVRTLVQTLQNPVERMALINDVFTKQLTTRLADPKRRGEIVDAVASGEITEKIAKATSVVDALKGKVT